MIPRILCQPNTVPSAFSEPGEAIDFESIHTHSPKMILFVHPTGNANVRAALTNLLDAGALTEFQTALAAYPGNLWDTLGKSPWGHEFQRRKFDERLQSLTVQHPFRELGRFAAGMLKLSWLKRHERGVFCIDAIYRALDRSAARRLRSDPKAFTGVYAYEDGALETFRAARQLGLRRFYDLPIAYSETAQRLLREEAARLPAWEPTLGGTRDSAAKLSRKAEELEAAEVVVCPSLFVARSLPEKTRATKKIVMAPFGSSPTGPAKDLAPPAGKKLRVMFAGSMAQRKGLADLFAAMRLLKRNDVELVVMGAPQVPMEFYRREYNEFTHEAGRPHSQVLELMRACDVFCLPSIVEGRALVMQEAMSQGLPLIITPNTGGEDLIEERATGFLVPIRDPAAIAEKITWFADHRSALPEMSRAAQAKAAELTWKAYGRKIVNAVLESAHD
jgi:glycosyltransferase involved in cell wall biosynthesis